MISGSGRLAVASYIIHTGWYVKSGQGFCPFLTVFGTWENTPLTVQFAVGCIETLNCVGRIDDRPNVSRKLKDWCDDIPIPFPAFHGVRVLF